MMRADFGETWSANPNVVKDSYTGYIPTGLDNTYSTFVGYSGAPLGDDEHEGPWLKPAASRSWPEFRLFAGASRFVTNARKRRSILEGWNLADSLRSDSSKVA
jgi:hypothetical protein